MQVKIGGMKFSAMHLFQGAILLLLAGNMLLMILLLNKIDALIDRNTLGNGGYENINRLGNLYQSPAYQEYFSGEIQQLETRVSEFVGG